MLSPPKRWQKDLSHLDGSSGLLEATAISNSMLTAAESITSVEEREKNGLQSLRLFKYNVVTVLIHFAVF